MIASESEQEQSGIKLAGPETGRGVAEVFAGVQLAEQALADKDALPSFARAALLIMLRQIVVLGQEISELDLQIAAWHAESEASRRLAAISGLGVITATAIAATVTDLDQLGGQGVALGQLGGAVQVDVDVRVSKQQSAE